MADSDSFINEVTEEVRRDRLFGFFRKWGWAFGLVVLLIVGGAGYSELRRAQATSAAEAFGDAVIDALEAEDAAVRILALEEIATEGPGAEMLLALLIAGQEAEAGDVESAAERLRTIGARDDMPERYRDLALLKAHLLAPGDRAEAMAMLDRLARPGAPYRALAVEQQAYMLIADGDIEAGQDLLRDLLGEAGTTVGLQQRVGQLMVALESGATLSDEPLPEPDPAELALPGLSVGVAVEDGPAVAEDETDIATENDTGTEAAGTQQGGGEENAPQE